MLIFPNVLVLASLSSSNKFLFIKPNIFSHESLASLALSLFSDILCSQVVNRIFPLVCSLMDSLEAMAISSFAVDITAS